MAIKSPLLIQRDEHDEALFAKKVTMVSSVTINAVVNAGSGGTSSTDDSAFTAGTDSGTPFMGFNSTDTVDANDVGVIGMTADRWVKTSQQSAATIYAVVNTAAVGQSSVVLDAGANYIGLVTVANTVPVTFSGNVTLDDGSLTGIVGNVTLDQGSIVQIGDGGGETVAIHLTHGDGQANTLNALIASGFLYGFNGTTWDRLRSDTTNGLDVDVTRLNGNVTLSDAKTFIGLVTATSLNAGTTKTFLHRNIELSTNSTATLYVATETWKATHLLLNSNATVRVSIRSGVTYLTGNASIGITLNPGGGWVENGSPDSPIYSALAVDQGIVVDKLDLTATSALVSGKIKFFDE